MKSKLLQRIPRILVSGMVVSALFLVGCSDDDTDKGRAYDPAKPVVLESFSPQEGGVGTKLIIRGENFGYDPTKVKVRIANDENREARVVSAKGNRIYAIIPARADTGKVTVTIGDEEQTQEVAFEEEFKYEFKKHFSTLVGGGSAEDKDGSFKEARFAQPVRLALDNINKKLYVLESYNSKCIREIDLINEKVSTPWRAPGLHNLRTICFGTTIDTLFIGVEGSSSNVSTVFLLRSDGFVRHKTYAPRSASNASILNPVDGELFINDYYQGMVLRWDRDKQEMVELARCFKDRTDFTFCWSHDGKYLYALCMDSPGSHSAIVRMEYDFKTKTLGEPNTWVGVDGSPGYQDGVGEESRVFGPYQMCTGPQGDFFLADTWNHCIRRIVDNAGTATVTTYAGIGGQIGFTEGDPLEAQMNYPTGVAVSDDGSTVYVADKDNHRICKITVE